MEISSTPDLRQLLGLENLPRSAAYDPQWILVNQMGPNPLWLAEWLAQAMDLKPGMHILDLGCGRGLSSIFFAREFGVEVWSGGAGSGSAPGWSRSRRQILSLKGAKPGCDGKRRAGRTASTRIL